MRSCRAAARPSRIRSRCGSARSSGASGSTCLQESGQRAEIPPVRLGPGVAFQLRRPTSRLAGDGSPTPRTRRSGWPRGRVWMPQTSCQVPSGRCCRHMRQGVERASEPHQSTTAPGLRTRLRRAAEHVVGNEPAVDREARPARPRARLTGTQSAGQASRVDAQRRLERRPDLRRRQEVSGHAVGRSVSQRRQHSGAAGSACWAMAASASGVMVIS